MSKVGSIYVRNSKAIGVKNLSQQGMVNECKALAAEQGITVGAIHIDDGKSGGFRDRPEFMAWLDDARQGRADVLISWAGDRLTREGVNVAGAILDVVEGKDPKTGAVTSEPVRFLSVDDGLDSEHGDAFRWNFVIKAEVARGERERMKHRAAANRRRMLEAGKWPSGPAPFGTQVDDQRFLSVNPEEAEVLHQVVAMLVGGTSMRQTLLWMHEQGYRTRRGNSWSRGSLTTTLESETTRKYVLTLAEQRALDARLHTAPTERPRGGRPVRWLVSGFARCAGCKRPLTTSRDARRDVTRYVCPTTSTVAECPARCTIRADRLDAWLVDRYLADWGDLPLVEIETLIRDEGALDALERTKIEAEAAMAADPTDEHVEAYRAAKAAWEEAEAQPVERVETLVYKGTHAEQWKAADEERRARLLRDAIVSLEVTKSTGPAWDDDRILVEWKHRDDLQEWQASKNARDALGDPW